MILTHPIEQTEWRGMLERERERERERQKFEIKQGKKCFIDESEEFLKTEDDFREKYVAQVNKI